MGLSKGGREVPARRCMFIAGMTEKALFHRPGILVTKKENGVGTNEPVDDVTTQIDNVIEDKQLGISKPQDANIIKAHKDEIKNLEKKKSLYSRVECSKNNVIISSTFVIRSTGRLRWSVTNKNKKNKTGAAAPGALCPDGGT